MLRSLQVSAFIGSTVVVMASGYLVYRVFFVNTGVLQTETLFQRWARRRAVKHHNSGLRRSIQRSLKQIRSSVPPGHSHADAASERNAATEIMLSCVRSLGFTPYVISPSMRESGEDGVREYHTIADLQQEQRYSDLTDDHIVVMTDIDYYVDMPDLVSLRRPVLCYTFQPETVSGRVKDGYFTISDNKVCYRVNGGKRVEHEIWNYNNDTIHVSPVGLFAKIMSFLSAPFAGWQTTNSVVAHVDQFAMSQHRRIVSIVPYASTPAWLIRAVDGVGLTRVNYDMGEGFNGLVYLSNDGPVASVGQSGQFAEATVELANFESLLTRHLEASSKHLIDTQRRSKLDPTQSAVLHRYITAVTKTPIAEIHKAGSIAPHFTILLDESSPLERGREYARRYANKPLSEEAVFPRECQSNDTACVAGRIVKPQTKAKARQNVSGRYYRYATEFVQAVVPSDLAGTGRPESVARVDERQDKAAQRVRTAQRDQDTDEPFMVKAFQKREAYGGVNDPRNISTVPYTHTLRLSGFTYSFKDEVLKHHSWYMPCRTPPEIAQSVVDLCTQAGDVVETDFSRFDGTITEWVRRQVEFACYLRWVHRDERAELLRLLESELNPKAYTKSGAYSPGSSRLSGSPLTTDGNCLVNAFCSFAAAREHGASVGEAFSDVGIVYGDDGLRSGRVPDALLKSTASDIGLDLRVCKRHTQGGHPSFLARVFLDPWTIPASVQDPKRTLLKLHTTTDVGVAPTVIGALKTTAYLTTDGKTPFIEHWCRAYQRCIVLGDLDGVQVNDLPWWYRDSDFRKSPWPQLDHDLAWEVVADSLGSDVQSVRDHCDRLDAYIGSPDAIPVFPVEPATPKLTAIVQDEIIQAGTTPKQPDTQNGKQSQRSTRRHGNGGSQATEAAGQSRSSRSLRRRERRGGAASQNPSKHACGANRQSVPPPDAQPGEPPGQRRRPPISARCSYGRSRPRTSRDGPRADIRAITEK